MSTPPRSLTQATATGVAWITSFQIARQVLQIISVSVLARHIPPAAYGLVGMAIIVTNLLETIRDMGTGTALVRERDMSDELASTGFWLNCMTGATVTLLLFLASWPAARFFHEPMVATILQFLSASFFMGALSIVPMAMLSRAMEFRKLAFAQTLGAICATASAITLALLGGKVRRWYPPILSPALSPWFWCGSFPRCTCARCFAYPMPAAFWHSDRISPART